MPERTKVVSAVLTAALAADVFLEKQGPYPHVPHQEFMDVRGANPLAVESGGPVALPPR